jgi:hypothetical protein
LIVQKKHPPRPKGGGKVQKRFTRRFAAGGIFRVKGVYIDKYIDIFVAQAYTGSRKANPILEK